MLYNTILLAEYNAGVVRARADYDKAQADIAAHEEGMAARAEAARQRKLARQRRFQARYRRVNSEVVRALQPHGTNAAYTRHLRDGEEACDPCLDAHSETNAAWRTNRKRML